jgi:hypothetical protein
LVDTLEEKRKTRAKKFYEAKIKKEKLRREKLNLPALKPIRDQLAKFGY